jgi:hypothetical protein
LHTAVWKKSTVDCMWEKKVTVLLSVLRTL